MSEPVNSTQRIFYIRPILLTLCFYALLLGLAYWLEDISPSGPCVPGLGFIVIFFLPFISTILMIATTIMAVRGRRSQIIPAAMHGLAIIIYLILWFSPGV